MYFIIVLTLTIRLCLIVNSFLLGTIKATISFFGNVLALILVSLSFFLYGWKIGCITIAIYVSAGFVFRPLGARIAAWLLRQAFQTEGKYVGLPSRKLYRLSKKISNYMRQPFSKIILSEKRSPDDELLNFCYSLPEIQELLSLNGYSKDYLTDIYRAITINGGHQWVGGHFVAASSLAYPETMQYFLENGVNQKTVFDALMYFERGIPLGHLKITGLATQKQTADDAVMQLNIPPQTPVEDPDVMRNRRLCSDGNCIGVLDANDRCVVCGKRG